MAMTDAPDRSAWLGHWYLLATWDGLLDRWPCIHTIEMITVPEGDAKLRFFADNLTPSGRRFRTAAIPVPSASGTLSWQGHRGATRLAPSWKVCLDSQKTLIAGAVMPSLLVPAGGLILARAELSPAEARLELLARGSGMGLLPRQMDNMAFRDAPADMTPGGSPRLRHFMATSKRGRRTQEVKTP